MQRLATTVAALVIIAGVALGALAAGWGDNEVIADLSSKEVVVKPGGTLTLVLDSNQTTGFTWVLTGNSHEGVLEQQGNVYKPPETDLLGAGGHEKWTFKAGAKGETTISMEYIRPWEPGIEPAQTFELTVIVR